MPNVSRVSLSFSFFALCVFGFFGGAAVAAQILPDAPPSVPAVFQNRLPTSQLAFLNDYVGKTTKEIRKDKRFRTLMKTITPQTEYHYGRDMPLIETIETMLDGTPLPVDVREGRYASIGSSGGQYLRGRGFLWFDMQQGIGMGAVFFHPVNGEPTPTLAVFSRQLNRDQLPTSELPPAFVQDLVQWESIANVPSISPRYFVPENGRKYVLLHDEDYCFHAPGVPGQSGCEEMNAEAADADVNAAYFMKASHNAANATAWTLDPEQTTWVTYRERTCGLGPVALPCRVRVTRERTRVLLKR